MKSQSALPWEWAFGATLVSACTMALLMSGYTWIWVSRNAPGPDQTVDGYFAHCLVMSLFVIVLQIPGLFAGYWSAARIRRRLSLALAVLCGMVLFILDCIAPCGNLYPSGATGIAVYSVVFPLLVTAVQLMPKQKTQKTSNKDDREGLGGAPPSPSS